MTRHAVASPPVVAAEGVRASRGRPLTPMARLGLVVLGAMTLMCVGTLPWTLSSWGPQTRYYDAQFTKIHHAVPQWGTPPPTDATPQEAGKPASFDDAVKPPPAIHAVAGTDNLGRSMLARCLLGGAISLGIGFSAAGISVLIGTTWGMVAGYAGGRTDAFLMRIVDILYGLPYILLVLLLVVAVEGFVSRVETSYIEKTKPVDAQTAEGKDPSDALKAQRAAMALRIEKWDKARVQAAAAHAAAAALPEGSERQAQLTEARKLDRAVEDLDPRPWLTRVVGGRMWVINVLSLLVAIGAVSWLTLARVVRGQVLSLKAQPFVEAARAAGCGNVRILARHLLPNLLGPIIVYTTLTVPQAILQESFLSFLGIGVKPPLPSWGNLAAEGLKELNPIRSYWWLLTWPCVLLGVTLLSLNFLGDGLRDKYDPRATR